MRQHQNRRMDNGSFRDKQTCIWELSVDLTQNGKVGLFLNDIGYRSSFCGANKTIKLAYNTVQS